MKIRIASKTAVKYCVLVLVMLVIAGGSFAVSVWIGETFFFDKLHYRKTLKFGYTSIEGEPIKSIQHPQIASRLQDLLIVLNHDQSQVLGTTTTEPEFTVALIGDSVAYGSGVTEHQRMGAVLENKLNRHRSTRVYTLAQPGDNFLDHYAKYRQTKRALHPDLFIVTIVDNDILLNGYEKYPDQKPLLEVLKTTCPQPQFAPNLSDPLIDWGRAAQDFYIPAFSSEYANRCYFATMIREMVKEDRVLFYEFQKSQIDTNTPVSIISREFEALVTGNGGELVAYDLSRGWSAVSHQETHPSAKMHEEYAQQLYEKILTLW